MSVRTDTTGATASNSRWVVLRQVTEKVVGPAPTIASVPVRPSKLSATPSPRRTVPEGAGAAGDGRADCPPGGGEGAPAPAPGGAGASPSPGRTGAGPVPDPGPVPGAAADGSPAVPRAASPTGWAGSSAGGAGKPVGDAPSPPRVGAGPSLIVAAGASSPLSASVSLGTVSTPTTMAAASPIRGRPTR